MCTPPSWNLKLMTSYAVPVENTLKYSLAPSALASNTLKLSLERRKKSLKFSFAPAARRKNRSFLSAHEVLPQIAPLWKNSCGCGAHGGFSDPKAAEPRSPNRLHRQLLVFHLHATTRSDTPFSQSPPPRFAAQRWSNRRRLSSFSKKKCLVELEVQADRPLQVVHQSELGLVKEYLGMSCYCAFEVSSI